MRRLAVQTEQLAGFCRDHDIRRLSLFGSTLAGTARPDSDIDLLVEFEPGREPGLLGLAAMEAELTAMLGGTKVDLRTPKDLSRYFREQVLRSAEVQYEGVRLERPEPKHEMSLARCLEAIAAAPLRPKMTWNTLKTTTREP